MQGRIYFPGNPWPEGHPIKALTWSGRLDAERGLFFDLHLESEDYDTERDVEDLDTDSDYEAPGAWGNYHSCILSSTFWHEGGWVVGTPKAPLSFLALAGRTSIVDGLVEPKFDFHDLDDRSFHIYLLGHDDVADHRIEFERDGDTWDLDWQGRIALAYAGDYDFDYTFRVEASSVTFSGIRVGAELDDDRAHALLADCCREAALFDLVTEGEVRWFKFRP